MFLLESYGKSKNAYVFSLESMEKGRNAYVFSWYSFPTVQNTYILPLSPLFSPNQMIFSSMWFPFPACSNRSKQIEVVPSPCTVCAQLVETNSLACAMFAVDCRQTTNFVFTVLAIEKKKWFAWFHRMLRKKTLKPAFSTNIKKCKTKKLQKSHESYNLTYIPLNLS